MQRSARLLTCPADSSSRQSQTAAEVGRRGIVPSWRIPTFDPRDQESRAPYSKLRVCQARQMLALLAFFLVGRGRSQLSLVNDPHVPPFMATEPGAGGDQTGPIKIRRRFEFALA